MIPYGRQDISEADIQAVVDVLRSDWLTQGPAIPRFEQSVADYTSAAHAVAVNSATAALHIACLAIEVGDEPSGDACDHYHRYPEDIALMAELGLNAYRFSVEWSRIEPEEGWFSRAALDHYRRVLGACHECGITPVVITGGDSAAVRRRVADLGICHAVYGAGDKLVAAAPVLAGLGVDWPEVAAMGDDWPDLPLMARAAFACAPAGAHAEVRAIAHHVTRAEGGHGAARECCDLLLCASGRYAALLAGEFRSLDTGSP